MEEVLQKNELQNRRSSFAAIGFGEIGAISILTV